MLQFRNAEIKDQDSVWKILQAINVKGDSFAFSPTISKEEMLAYWFDGHKRTYVALDGNEIAGTFFLKDNQPGLGSHIANAAYAVSTKAGGKGMGRKMGQFSLEEAKRLGYTAMQFNLVVKTNEKAVKLWKSLGFEIIGEIPEAFKHAQYGLVNAYIMFRKL